MSKDDLLDLSKLVSNGDTKEVTMPCGATIFITRFDRTHGRSISDVRGFDVEVYDAQAFAAVEGDYTDDLGEYEHKHIKICVLDKSIPTLRALFNSLGNVG